MRNCKGVLYYTVTLQVSIPYKYLFCENTIDSQCGKFKIFVSVKFYVKSILSILEVQKLPFLPF